MTFTSSPYTHLSELIFVGDPMCSWCYGFNPELKRVRSELQDIPFSMIMGGLRDGDRFTEEKLKNHLGYWEAVHTVTGLPFNDAAIAQKNFNYTTEPACRAVITAEILSPEQSYALYTALQQAFYAQGRDITQTAVILDIAERLGFERTAFLQHFESQDTIKATRADKQKAKTYGVSSFPTLIVIDKEGHMSQIRGYKKHEELLALLKR